MSSILDREWEAFYGATPASMAAIIARKYMHDFNVEKEALAMIPVNDHNNASKNPDAQYRNKITVEQALNSTPVADPLNLMDCSPVSDGAAAVVLASEDYVKKNGKDGIRILSSAIAEDYLSVGSRESIYTFNSARLAAEKAFMRSGLNVMIYHLLNCMTHSPFMRLLSLRILDSWKRVMPRTLFTMISSLMAHCL